MSTLPTWDVALAVVAHPDDESFGLGAVLDALTRSGTTVFVLCFTQGEASTLHGVPGDLAEVRAGELRAAADRLGIEGVRLLAYPDGRLSAEDPDRLLGEVADYAELVRPDGLVVFDVSGVTGHPDHRAATTAAIGLAARLGIGVLGWTVPESVAHEVNAELGTAFAGRSPDEIDLVIEVERERQRQAIDCHASQAVPGSALWRRLDLLGSREHLCWVRRPPAQGRVAP